MPQLKRFILKIVKTKHSLDDLPQMVQRFPGTVLHREAPPLDEVVFVTKVAPAVEDGLDFVVGTFREGQVADRFVE